MRTTKASLAVGGLGVAALASAFLYGTQPRQGCAAVIGFGVEQPSSCDPIRSDGMHTMITVALLGVVLLVVAYVIAYRAADPMPGQPGQAGHTSLRPVLAFFVGFLGVIFGFTVFLLGLATSSGVTGLQAKQAGASAAQLTFLVGTPLGIVVGILLARRSAAKQGSPAQAWPAPMPSALVSIPAAPVSAPPAPAPAPGWYVDSLGVTRWWDGQGWTEHSAP